MDAIMLLRQDHAKMLGLLSALESGPTLASGANESELRARKDLVTQLVIAESAHEAVEERLFWPMVRDVLPDGDALADHAIAQEETAKQVLHELENAQPDEADFESMIAMIISDGRERIEYEQTRVWPKVLAAVRPDRLTELGEKMAGAKDSEPTRPHPATPSDPGARKTAGALAAMADELRDTATGRGR